MSPSTINQSPSTDFPDRLISLHDGRPGLRGTIHTETRDPSPSLGGEGQGEGEPNHISANSCNSCLDFISSDETLDRYDEIISAAGWNLTNYQRNPVFQNAHQYGDILFTLGKALITEVRSIPSTKHNQPSTCLYQRIQFAADVNPMARIAYGLYKGKFLNAVSVGFVPLKWQDAAGAPSPGGEGRGEGESTKFRRKFLEQELLEVSAVAIPANPNALALGLKSGAVEKSDLRDTADLIYYTLNHPTAAHTSPSPGGEGRDACRAEAAFERRPEGGISLSHSPAHSLTHSYLPSSTLNHQLLFQLARQLHQLLKHT